VAADLALVVLENGADNMGQVLFISLVIHVVVFGVNLVEVGVVAVAELVNPFLENDVPTIVGGGEDFGEFGL